MYGLGVVVNSAMLANARSLWFNVGALNHLHTTWSLGQGVVFSRAVFLYCDLLILSFDWVFCLPLLRIKKICLEGEYVDIGGPARAQICWDYPWSGHFFALSKIFAHFYRFLGFIRMLRPSITHFQFFQMLKIIFTLNIRLFWTFWSTFRPTLWQILTRSPLIELCWSLGHISYDLTQL